MIAKIGFSIFALGLVFAIFTSNLLISPKEKSLAQEYKIKRQSHAVFDAEAKHAYVNVLIALFARILMAIGSVLMAAGYFFI